jgi:hypothetical protein
MESPSDKILVNIYQDYNIKTGAEYFASILEQDGGNILLTIGRYNGWKQGMTYVGDESLTKIVCLT